MTETVVVSIDNSDDKLTQREWSSMCMRIFMLSSELRGVELISHGFTPGGSSKQSAHYIFSVPEDELRNIYGFLRLVAADFGQESIAVLTGTTRFMTPNGWKDGEED